MNMLFKAYMMGYAAVLLNLAYQQCRVNPKGVNPNITSIFEKMSVSVRSLAAAPPESQQGTNTSSICANII